MARTYSKIKILVVAVLATLILVLLMGVPGITGNKEAGVKYPPSALSEVDGGGRDLQKVQGGLLRMRSTAP